MSAPHAVSARHLPRPHDAAPVPAAADLLAELGGAFCPSLSTLLERLIDRQAVPATDPRP